LIAWLINDTFHNKNHCKLNGTFKITCCPLKKRSSVSNALFFQPKRRGIESTDRYEQEAEQVSSQLMQSGNSQNSFFTASPITISRMASQSPGEQNDWNKKTPEVSELLKAGGQPLPATVKRFFESRMGYDFGRVRIHYNAAAVKTAHSINALAYTAGNNIVFGQHQFNPDSYHGKKLLAHELTHVVQQNNVNGKINKKTDDQLSETNYVRDVSETIRSLESEVNEKCGERPLKRLTRLDPQDDARILAAIRRMLLIYWRKYAEWKSSPTGEKEVVAIRLQAEIYPILRRAGLGDVIGFYSQERSLNLIDCFIAQANLKLVKNNTHSGKM